MQHRAKRRPVRYSAGKSDDGPAYLYDLISLQQQSLPTLSYCANNKQWPWQTQGRLDYWSVEKESRRQNVSIDVLRTNQGHVTTVFCGVGYRVVDDVGMRTS